MAISDVFDRSKAHPHLSHVSHTPSDSDSMEEDTRDLRVNGTIAEVIGLKWYDAEFPRGLASL